MNKENISLIINCQKEDIENIDMAYFNDKYARVYFNIKPQDQEYLNQIINIIETSYYSIWDYNNSYQNINLLDIISNNFYFDKSSPIYYIHINCLTNVYLKETNSENFINIDLYETNNIIDEIFKYITNDNIQDNTRIIITNVNLFDKDINQYNKTTFFYGDEYFSILTTKKILLKIWNNLLNIIDDNSLYLLNLIFKKLIIFNKIPYTEEFFDENYNKSDKLIYSVKNSIINDYISLLYEYTSNLNTYSDMYYEYNIDIMKVFNLSQNVISKILLNNTYQKINFDKIKNDECIVVIPIYQKKLSFIEKNILQNNINKLNIDYDICFIAPYKIDINEFIKNNDIKISNYKIIYYSDQLFESQLSYSYLCENHILYEPFVYTYKYILLCQLDVIINSNDLHYWCQQNYDYIGAPHFIPKYNKYIVGNGGLSLRNIKVFYNILTSNYDYNGNIYNKQLLEDRFFSEEMENKLNICPVDIAFYFSQVQYEQHNIDLNGYTWIKDIVPFGFHRPTFGNNAIMETLLNKYDEEIKIDVYTICYNEIKILPYVINYWKKFANHVYVYDNYSNDGSFEYLSQFPNFITVIQYESNNEANDNIYLEIKNNVWKKSRGVADYVVVCDMDEIIYAKNIKQQFRLLKQNNITICSPYYYELIDKNYIDYNDITDFDDNYLIHKHIKGGVHNPNSKQIIFDPNKIIEINYSIGGHENKAIGEINQSINNESIFLFHLKYFGIDNLFNKNKVYQKRIYNNYIRYGYGCHYFKTYDELIDIFNEFEKNIQPINNL